MAHSPNTATASRSLSDYWWSGTETEASATTAIILSSLPPNGRLVAVKAARTVGAATAIRPWISTAASANAAAAAAAGTLVWQAGDPSLSAERPLGADALVEQPLNGAIYRSATGSLYIYSGCNAAADNTVVWGEIDITDGWV